MLRKLLTAPLLALLACLVAAGLVACGGGEEDEDPQEILDQTFESGKDYASGVVAIDLHVEGDQSGVLDLKLDGPFQNAEGGFPAFDLSADVNVERGEQSFGFTGGLISTGDQGFVKFQDTDYEFEKSSFQAFKQLFISLQGQTQGQDGGPILDPSSFLTDLSNEGTEDIEGAETVHISGRADAAKFVEAVGQIPGSESALENNPLAQQPDLIKKSDFDVYSGVDDKRLRKLEADIAYDQPADTTAAGDTNVSVKFTLTFSDLGEPQTIAAPASPRPVGELLKRYGGDLSALLGGLGGGQAQGSGGGAAPTAPATPAPPSSEQSQKYLDCLGQAQGQEEIQACAEALQ